jgi:chromosome segregation ATPase
MADQNNRLLDVEKKVAAQEVLVAKFDTALDKISEVSLNVSKLLAVHEQRIEAQEEQAKESKEADTALHSRISSTEHRLRQEMSDGQKEILGEIKNLRSDVEDLGDDLIKKHDALRSDLETEVNSKVEEISGRVSKLERLAWIVIGATTIVGFLIAQGIGLLQAIPFH